MLNEHFQLDSNALDELDGLLSMTALNEIDLGKYTMKILPGSDRLYQIKSDRAVQLANTMAMYRKNCLFCDVNLYVNGRQFPAHKVVLASACPYFATMFGTPGHIEARPKHDVDLSKTVPCADAMDIILDFLYTSQVQLNETCVCSYESITSRCSSVLL